MLLEHRKLDEVRGVRAEATAILGNLGRLPTELSIGGDDENITISIGGEVSADVGALKLEGETLPEGGAKCGAKIKGNAGEVEIHGCPEGAGASFKRGRTKVGVDLGKGIKAEVQDGDLVTVKGSVVARGRRQGELVGADHDRHARRQRHHGRGRRQGHDRRAGDRSPRAAGRSLDNLSVESVIEHGPLLKKAVTDVRREGEEERRTGQARLVGRRGRQGRQDAAAHSGTVTLTWVSVPSGECSDARPRRSPRSGPRGAGCGSRPARGRRRARAAPRTRRADVEGAGPRPRSTPARPGSRRASRPRAARRARSRRRPPRPRRSPATHSRPATARSRC